MTAVFKERVQSATAELREEMVRAEQEYLAEQLEIMRVAFCQKQKNLDLNLAIKNSERYTGFRNQNFSPDLLRDRIDNLLK